MNINLRKSPFAILIVVVAFIFSVPVLNIASAQVTTPTLTLTRNPLTATAIRTSLTVVSATPSRGPTVTAFPTRTRTTTGA